MAYKVIDIEGVGATYAEKLAAAGINKVEELLAKCATPTGRKALAEEPQSIDAELSGNIIKNVKSVIVPNTNGMKGLKASVAIGIIGGNPDKEEQGLFPHRGRLPSWRNQGHRKVLLQPRQQEMA